jgi:CDP-paratose 2-epimerase
MPQASDSKLPAPCCKPLHVLITGICGFVGSTLALELRRVCPNLNIYGIDNLIRRGSETNVDRLRAAGCHLLIGDIRHPQDLDQVPPVDWVIDCAANPSVLAGVDGKSSSYEVMDHNLVGTLQLLEFCKKHRAGFILLSTSRVYSIAALSALPVEEHDGAFHLALEVTADKLKVKRSDAGLPDTCCLPPVTDKGITESFSTQPPLSLYGMSKCCSEHLALEYGETFGFPVWINRCGVLAGAGQFGRADQGIFSYWINSWLRKKPLKYIGFGGKGFQVRDALHPRDVVPLLLQQMQDPFRNVEKIQNLSGGAANAMSLFQLSAWCEERWGLHEVFQDSASRRFDLPWMVLDSSRATLQWNWSPQISLEAILEEIAVHAETHPEWLELSGN